MSFKDIEQTKNLVKELVEKMFDDIFVRITVKERNIKDVDLANYIWNSFEISIKLESFSPRRYHELNLKKYMMI